MTMVVVISAAAAGGIVGAQFVLATSLRRLEKRLGSLDRLQGLEAALQKLAGREAALDLRRTEHTLLDVRDHLKRLEERLLAVVESRARESAQAGGNSLANGTELAVGASPAAATSVVTDRILTRLLALGYERIQIVTSADDLALLGSTEGVVIVEARRDGALCKGRVRVARGLVGAVELQPAYSAFP